MECKNSDKIVWDLEVCKDITLLKSASDIMIYGAGKKGKDIFFQLKNAGISVSFFLDLNINKWDAHIEDVKIISPFEVKYAGKDNDGYIYILACIEQPKEVVDIFKYMKLTNVKIITYWGINMALYVNRQYLYGIGTKEIILFDIQKKRRKDRFLDIGFSFMREIVTSPENAIWVIQPGKTASSTLEKRLEEKMVPYIKTHKLEYPEYLLGSDHRKIWEEGVEERKKKPLKIIIAVREPIARDYSAFWQAFSEGNEMAMEMPILHQDFQKTYDGYIKILMDGSSCMKSVLGASMIFSWGDEFEWFDEQIKKYLGIDVFQYPFDKEKGYTIIEKGSIQILLYKMERLETILDEVGSFVGSEKLSSINENIGENKWYGLAYSQFRKEVKISKKYVDHYYCGNRKMDHFYSLEEKERFLDKWKRNIRKD